MPITIKKINLFNPQWKLTILTMLALFCWYGSVQAQNFTRCNPCHINTLSEEHSRFYLHSPFALEECGDCHALPVSIPSKASSVSTDTVLANGHQIKISWLADSKIKHTSHAFLLPSNKVGSSLIVEMYGENGQSLRQEIHVPLLSELIDYVDIGRPPIISNVQIPEVEYGISLSATISWQTDVLTDAAVHYGEADFSQVSHLKDRFSRYHKITLNQIKSDVTYRFMAISRDLFGRNHTSEEMTFSTKKNAFSRLFAKKEDLSKSIEDAELKTTFYRLGENYLTQLSFEHPVSVFLGSKGPMQTSSLASHEEIEAHTGLSSEAVISMQACRNCHKDQSTATHPVNVLPKPGMVIPPEYPTLPDGRISCNSCHEAHASAYEYLARKSSKRVLCVGCHKDML
jgi:predicted CXXCH cytochrome family protein